MASLISGTLRGMVMQKEHNKYIEGKDLLKRWNLEDWQLLEFIRIEINAYRSIEKRFLHPYHRALREPYILDGDEGCVFFYQILVNKNGSFLNPHPFEKNNQHLRISDIDLLKILPDCLFLLEGVEAVETLENELLKSQQRQTADRGTQQKSKQQTENFFIKEGNNWHIGFEGKEARINHVDGLFYTSCLLNSPGKTIPDRDLYLAISGKGSYKTISIREAIAHDMHSGHKKQVIHDNKSKKDYHNKIKALQGEYAKVEEGNTPEDEIMKGEIKKEIYNLLEILNERYFADPTDKKRQANLTKRFHTAYNAIGDAGMENLKKHLQDHIKTNKGYDRVYVGNMIWEIIQ